MNTSYFISYNFQLLQKEIDSSLEHRTRVKEVGGWSMVTLETFCALHFMSNLWTVAWQYGIFWDVNLSRFQEHYMKDTKHLN